MTGQVNPQMGFNPMMNNQIPNNNNGFNFNQFGTNAGGFNNNPMMMGSGMGGNMMSQ
jgi:hypothetical protein